MTVNKARGTKSEPTQLNGAPHADRSGNQKLSYTEREDLRTRYAQGESRVNLAREHGVSIATMHAICKGIDTRIKYDHEAIRARARAGQTLEQITRETGVCKGQARKITRGIYPRRGKLTPALREQMRAQAFDGVPRRVLAQEYGVCACTVNNVCTGIDTRYKLDFGDRASVRAAALAGTPRAVLAQQHGVSIYTINAICKGIDNRAVFLHARREEQRAARVATIHETHQSRHRRPKT